MKSLLVVVLLATLTSCGGFEYTYPGVVPKSCRVSDGFCYHRVIVNDNNYWDVYIWSPRYGWAHHHREPFWYGVR